RGARRSALAVEDGRLAPPPVRLVGAELLDLALVDHLGHGLADRGRAGPGDLLQLAERELARRHPALDVLDGHPPPARTGLPTASPRGAPPATAEDARGAQVLLGHTEGLERGSRHAIGIRPRTGAANERLP